MSDFEKGVALAYMVVAHDLGRIATIEELRRYAEMLRTASEPGTQR